jgi:hypothetical protein
VRCLKFRFEVRSCALWQQEAKFIFVPVGNILGTYIDKKSLNPRNTRFGWAIAQRFTNACIRILKDLGWSWRFSASRHFHLTLKTGRPA